MAPYTFCVWCVRMLCMLQVIIMWFQYFFLTRHIQTHIHYYLSFQQKNHNWGQAIINFYIHLYGIWLLRSHSRISVFISNSTHSHQNSVIGIHTTMTIDEICIDVQTRLALSIYNCISVAVAEWLNAKRNRNFNLKFNFSKILKISLKLNRHVHKLI